MALRHHRLLFVLLLTAFGLGCGGSRLDGSASTIRLMTFNIAHGRGADGRVDIKRIADVIKNSGADIVALQEVDRWTERTGKLDLIVELSERTGLTYAFGKTSNYDGGEFGNAFLVRFPIVQEENVLYKNSTNEQRGLLILVLDVRAGEIVVMNTHLDHQTEDSARLSAVHELIAKAKTYSPKAIIACGDFHDAPQSRTIQTLKTEFEDCWEMLETGNGFTYPSSSPTRRRDYIFVGKRQEELTWMPRPIRARVLSTDASDHLPLVVEFKLYGKEDNARSEVHP